MKKLLTILAAILLAVLFATAQKKEGLALTPPMGWNSWNKFGCDINENLIKEVADAFQQSGMREAGYEYIVIDDCWQVKRDGIGTTKSIDSISLGGHSVLFCTLLNNKSPGQIKKDLVSKIGKTNGLIALWDFKEKEGHPRKAYGMGKFPLKEMNGTIPRVDEGPLSGYSALLGNKAFFCLPNNETGELNIYGEKQGVTLLAWIRWKGNTGFVGGMWNEYQDGGKRQYGLFVSLPYYNGADQVCGHISKTGKPTPPFPYSIDYSASKGVVTKDEWQYVAFTYDGEWIKSYLNGNFEEREKELIDHTSGFEGYPEGLIQSKNPYYFPGGIGNNGSDFTVGAVSLKSGMGNFFIGQIGGLAVFNRALNEEEIASFKLPDMSKKMSKH